MITREQDYQEVRRLLVYPKQNRPKPDAIVSNLLKAEQLMMNRANGQNQAWSVNTVSFTTVEDTNEYALQAAPGSTFGKPLFAYRELDDNTILPVPFTDYLSETLNQKYDFKVPPVDSGETEIFFGEKISFYRTATGVFKAVIHPTPDDTNDERVYYIKYASGALDWTRFEWTDVPMFPEFSAYRQLLAAIATINHCEWPGYDPRANLDMRRELRSDLMAQVALQEEEFRPFIRSHHHDPAIDEVGYFWE